MKIRSLTKRQMLGVAAIALVSALLIATGLKSDDLAGLSSSVIGSALAAFGGAYFAFRFAKHSQDEADRKYFRVAALEAINDLYLDQDGYGSRESFKVLRGPHRELERLARRTGDEEIVKSVRQFIRSAAIVVGVQSSDEYYKFGTVPEDFEQTTSSASIEHKRIRLLVEDRLLREYGIGQEKSNGSGRMPVLDPAMKRTPERS